MTRNPRYGALVWRVSRVAANKMGADSDLWWRNGPAHIDRDKTEPGEK